MKTFSRKKNKPVSVKFLFTIGIILIFIPIIAFNLVDTILGIFLFLLEFPFILYISYRIIAQLLFAKTKVESIQDNIDESSSKIKSVVTLIVIILLSLMFYWFLLMQGIDWR